MTNTERPLHFFITEADDFRAWAGDGPNAAAIQESEWINAMDEFQELVSDELYEHDGDFDRIDTEALAAQVLLSYESTDTGEYDPAEHGSR